MLHKPPFLLLNTKSWRDINRLASIISFWLKEQNTFKRTKKVHVILCLIKKFVCSRFIFFYWWPNSSRIIWRKSARNWSFIFASSSVINIAVRFRSNREINCKGVLEEYCISISIKDPDNYTKSIYNWELNIL